MTARSVPATTLASANKHPSCREVVFEGGLLLGIHLAVALAVVLTLAAAGIV